MSEQTLKLTARRKNRYRWDNFPWATKRSSCSWVYHPLISIILPVYNHGHLLAQSVDSILKQSYPFELIIINDGSTDCTSKVLEQYQSDSNIIIINQPNQGLAKALNKGIKLAKGEFISWTSADNLYLDSAFTHMANFLLANPQIGLVFANVELIDDSGNPYLNSGYRLVDQLELGSAKLMLPGTTESICEFNDNFVNACFLSRRSVFLTVGEYRSEYRGYEDYDYWLRLSLISRIAHLDHYEPLYQYRLHKSSLTSELAKINLSSKQRDDVLRTNYFNNLLNQQISFTISACNSSLSNTQVIFIESLIRLLHSQGYLTNLNFLTEENSSTAISHTKIDENSLELQIQVNLNHNEYGKLNLPISTCRHKWTVHFLRSSKIDFSFVHQCHKKIINHKSTLPPFALIGTQEDGNVVSQTIFLQSIELPKILRRARDSSFHAVSPAEGSKGTILVFAPDQLPTDRTASVAELKAFNWNLESLVTTVSRLRQFTFVIYCNNPAQRKFADKVNLLLTDNFNLRIIDTSESIYQANSKNAQIQDCSLMYVLSSVDLVFSLKGPELTVDNLLELRIEAAIAASAGIGTLLLLSSIPNDKSTLPYDLIKADRLSKIKIEDIHIQLRDIIKSIEFSTPNLGIVLQEGAGNYLDNLEKAMLSAIEGIDLKSAEQWLEQQTSSLMAKKFAGTILSLIE